MHGALPGRRRWRRSRRDGADDAARAEFACTLRAEIARTRRALGDDGMSQEKVDHLRALIELERAELSRARGRSDRLVTVGLVVLTVGVVGVLLFGRVAQTRIDLEASVSGIELVSAVDQPLFRPLDAAAVGATGVGALRRPARDGAGILSETYPGPAGGAVQIKPGTQEGAATLAALSLRAGARATMTGVEDGFLLQLGQPTDPVTISIRGPIRITRAGHPGAAVDAAVPRSVTLIPGSAGLNLSVLPARKEKVALTARLAVAGLRFTEVEETFLATTTRVQEVSTIRSATLYLSELRDSVREIRPGGLLSFQVADGEILRASIRDGTMSLRFAGTVRDLRLGSGPTSYSLMPSYLEWLSAQHALSLFWGASLYLLGLLLGMMKWLRN